MVCLTGADPTLLGGGELARDVEVDVMDTLSETISLTGVPRREGCLSTVGEEATAATAGERMRGLSNFGVGTTRIVRGWTVRGAGDPVRETAVLGVPGREIAPLSRIDVRSVLSGVSGLPGSDGYLTDCMSFFDASCAAAISSLPGCCRFSIGFVGVSGSSFFPLRVFGAISSKEKSNTVVEVDGPLALGEPEASMTGPLFVSFGISSCAEGPALDLLTSTVPGSDGLASFIGVATRDGVLGRTGTTGGSVLDAAPKDWPLPCGRPGATGMGRGATNGGKSWGCDSPGGAGIEVAGESSCRVLLIGGGWGASEAASWTRLSTELIASSSRVGLLAPAKNQS